MAIKNTDGRGKKWEKIHKIHIQCLFDLASYWYTVSYLDLIFFYVPFGTVITTHQMFKRYSSKLSCGTDSPFNSPLFLLNNEKKSNIFLHFFIFLTNTPQYYRIGCVMV